MQVQTFTATTAAEAVRQIRATLGPEAVVLHVRQAPSVGLSRLWIKPRIEVVAGVPDPVAVAVTETPADTALAELREEITAIRRSLANTGQGLAPAPEAIEPFETPTHALPTGHTGWRSEHLLLESGFLPVHVHRILDRVRAEHGPEAPSELSAELSLVRGVLEGLWRAPHPGPTSRTHVLIGPPGVGKSTALCKWLAQVVLIEGDEAAVWRLDAHVANTAESVAVYADILGIPVERQRPEAVEGGGAGLRLVDLPGVTWNDPAALEDYRAVVRSIPGAELHLVLNAAYDVQVLTAQMRAFSSLPITDLILTHVDEAPRWGKLWNLVLGTNYSVRFVGGGQNVPGMFERPTGRQMVDRVIRLSSID